MSSILKVDTIQDQSGNNIINENAGTITIGASGDTITLAAGASQSGFGRSGSVNWDTTPKTTGFTAVSGNGYFCDTTSAAFTVTLPATPSAGDIVAIADYNGTAITNNITIGRNSSDINGSATDLTITANYSAVTLVYVDATTGWRSVDSSNPNDITVVPEYILATGGTVTCCGDYKIHTFTGPGTFTVISAGNVLGSDTVDYLVVAGGGSGGNNHGGGGGAGGYRESSGAASGCYSASPLGSGVSALPVSTQGYPIVVGAGGAAGPSPSPGSVLGNPGNNSVFSSITSAGGAGGGSFLNRSGLNGGSGSGGAGAGSGQAPGPVSPLGGGNKGLGNTPPVSPSQGNNGGCGSASPDAGNGGGGGGATVAGGNSSGTTPGGGSSGTGGNGATSSINGTPTARAGGGSGGRWGNGTVGAAGTGGGGTGGQALPIAATGGSTNTGGGGGGGADGGGGGGAGGSGIVIIRYKFQ